jgi:hypothetical protein
MSIEFKSNTTIIEILEGTDQTILQNIDLLAKDYLDKKSKKLNKGCAACINEMVLTLKNYYKMTQFKFKRNAASYKNKKGDTTTISNSTMTDEKAIAFLKTNDKRISLFSEFPSNWKKLIKGEAETEEQKVARLAIAAEVKAAKDAKKKDTKKTGSKKDSKKDLKIVKDPADKAEDNKEKDVDTTVADAEAEATNAAEQAAADAMKPSKGDLMKLSLKDLRTKYPEVRATKISDFVEKVLAL